MMRGEHIRSKVYVICLGVVRKLATCTFRLRQCKEKNMLHGCIQGPKTRNKLQIKYLEVKEEEATNKSQISSLKCNNNAHVMYLENEIVKLRYV